MDRLLRLLLGRFVRRGTLRFTTARGAVFTVGDGSAPRVAIRFMTKAAERGVVLDPELKLGEAYMDGTLQVEDGAIAEFLDLIIYNLAQQQPTILDRSLTRVRALARNLLAFNNRSRSSRNARHHYNIDDRVYRMFLDSDMQYSCAYFEYPNCTLEEAQQAKKRHIAVKLFLNDRSRCRVLDIGSGWGGLGLHLAREHQATVVGINLSDEQVKIAGERAKAENLPCQFRVQDYRDVSENFDRIVSIGMFEHVGKQFHETFFRKCFDLLSDDGVMLLHTVGRWNGPAITNAWIWRYIFPGGYAPALSELTPIIEKSGFIISDIEVLRLHYAETLRHWRERFFARRDEARKIFGERFVRMWEFYLAGFEPCFRYYGLAVFQIQLIKRLDATPTTRDYIYLNGDYGRRNMHAAEAAE
ncbi:MAG: class I SAM-dependent methyltransferase [Xanthobacteraceae bacterium]